MQSGVRRAEFDVSRASWCDLCDVVVEPCSTDAAKCSMCECPIPRRAVSYQTFDLSCTVARVKLIHSGCADNFRALSFERTSLMRHRCKHCDQPKKAHFNINGRFVCRNCCVCAERFRNWQGFWTYGCSHCRARHPRLLGVDGVDAGRGQGDAPEEDHADQRAALGDSLAGDPDADLVAALRASAQGAAVHRGREDAAGRAEDHIQRVRQLEARLPPGSSIESWRFLPDARQADALQGHGAAENVGGAAPPPARPPTTPSAPPLPVTVPVAPPVDLYARECIICLENPRHVRFGCGHSCLCRECLETFMQQPRPACPTCRQPVSASDSALLLGTHVAAEESFVNPRPPA